MWLLEQTVLEQLLEAKRGGLAVSGEQQAVFEQQVSASDGPRCLAIAGDCAQIRVEGLLTKKPSLFARWFYGGNTAYTELQDAIAMAERDPRVKRLELSVDSPGGESDGLFDVFAALQAAEKPISVRAESAFSAAYGIAAVAGPIEAKSSAARFGSVGVAVSLSVATDKAAYDWIDLTNTDSPDKRPDVRTEEGRAVVVRHLDEIYELFATAIAEGRDAHASGSFSLDRVRSEFGRGALFVAGEAKRRGMIDSIAEPALRAVGTQTSANATATRGARENESMTLDEFKSQHPALYAEVFGLGVNQGVSQERDRACAHLKMGAASGAVETAHKAIADGDEMTRTLQATYMATALNKRDIDNRQADDQATEAALQNKKLETEDAFGADVIAAFNSAIGEEAADAR